MRGRIEFLKLRWGSWFFRYGELTDDGKNQVGELDDDSIVYASGLWAYVTKNYKSDDFDIFEVDDVLCNIGIPSEVHSCYAAALRLRGGVSDSVAIFAFSGMGASYKNRSNLSAKIRRILEMVILR